MKHVKIYEEYSDADLKGLMGDLETIGHKHRMMKGEDFGFDEDMKGENTGAKTLFLSKFGAEVLKKNLEKDFGMSYMSTYGIPEKSFFPYWKGVNGTKTASSRWPSSLGAYIYPREQHWKYKNMAPGTHKDNFPPFFIWLSAGHKNFPASYWGQAHKEMGKDRVKKMYAGVLEYINKISGQ